MSWRSWFGMESKPDAAFDVFGVENLPPEMREGMTFGGALAPRISRAEALQVPAVLRSRNLICTPAALPIHLRNSEREIVERSDAPTTLFDQIDPDVPNIVVMAATYEDLLFEGASLWRVVERNYQGWPTYAEHIEHRRWGVGSDGLHIDGYLVSDRDVIVFRSPNPPLLVHAARAIRTCLTLDRTASRYADDPMGLGYLTPKDGARIDESDAKISGLLDKWEANRRKRVWGFVGAALEAKTLQFNAEQIQLADQRQHAVLEIARSAGVDPERLGVSTTSRTYKNAETERLDMLDFTHRAYVTAIEQRLSMRDVTPRGYYVKTNMDAFLRSDTKTRMETYAIGKPLGLYPDERLAELEDIPRVETPKEPTPNTRSVGDNPTVERRLEVVD